VRDLATWMLHMVEQRGTGTYNAVGPAAPVTMAGFLDTCRTVAGSDARFVWVDDESLAAAGVGRSEIPLWMPSPMRSKLFTVSNQRALDAGLTLRPLADTIADVLAWEREHTQPVSFSREREAEV